jgi:hypothetical protein
VAIGLGTGFGVASFGARDASKRVPCSESSCGEATRRNEDAQLFADVSTASFIVAGAALAAGAYLWFFDPARSSASSSPTTVRIAPALGTRAAALTVDGRF